MNEYIHDKTGGRGNKPQRNTSKRKPADARSSAPGLRLYPPLLRPSAASPSTRSCRKDEQRDLQNDNKRRLELLGKLLWDETCSSALSAAAARRASSFACATASTKQAAHRNKQIAQRDAYRFVRPALAHAFPSRFLANLRRRGGGGGNTATARAQ